MKEYYALEIKNEFVYFDDKIDVQNYLKKLGKHYTIEEIDVILNKPTINKLESNNDLFF